MNRLAEYFMFPSKNFHQIVHAVVHLANYFYSDYTIQIPPLKDHQHRCTEVDVNANQQVVAHTHTYTRYITHQLIINPMNIFVYLFC